MRIIWRYLLTLCVVLFILSTLVFGVKLLNYVNPVSANMSILRYAECIDSGVDKNSNALKIEVNALADMGITVNEETYEYVRGYVNDDFVNLKDIQKYQESDFKLIDLAKKGVEINVNYNEELHVFSLLDNIDHYIVVSKDSRYKKISEVGKDYNKFLNSFYIWQTGLIFLIAISYYVDKICRVRNKKKLEFGDYIIVIIMIIIICSCTSVMVEGLREQSMLQNLVLGIQGMKRSFVKSYPYIAVTLVAFKNVFVYIFVEMSNIFILLIGLGELYLARISGRNFCDFMKV